MGNDIDRVVSAAMLALHCNELPARAKHLVGNNGVFVCSRISRAHFALEVLYRESIFLVFDVLFVSDIPQQRYFPRDVQYKPFVWVSVCHVIQCLLPVYGKSPVLFGTSV